jgi:hypothetical protein
MAGTRFTKRRRLQIIERMYLLGQGPKQIHESLQSKFTVSYPTIRNDIVEIRKAWTKRFGDLEEFGNFSGEYLARAMDIYKKAMDQNDFRCAYGILKDLSLLLGVDLRQATIPIDATKLSGFDTAEELEQIEKILVEATEVANARHRAEDRGDPEAG